nr:MAG TPA: hypothetical protein [Caudoviricetes sp.]
MKSPQNSCPDSLFRASQRRVAETGHGSDLESEVIQVIALAPAGAPRYLEDGE